MYQTSLETSERELHWKDNGDVILAIETLLGTKTYSLYLAPWKKQWESRSEFQENFMRNVTGTDAFRSLPSDLKQVRGKSPHGLVDKVNFLRMLRFIW